MNYVYGALAGLVWGALAAFINYKINQAALKKSTNTAVLTANFLRMAVDLLALGAVYLLRRKLPFSFEATMIGAALSLSLLTVVLAYHLARPEK